MRKSIFLLLILFVALSKPTFAQYDEEDYNEELYKGWIMVGYGYSQSVDNSWSADGPFKVTVGGNLWRIVAMELALDTSWKEWNYQGKNVAWTFDMKPYVLLQYPIGNKKNALLPYMGIAPVFSISGLDYDNLNDKSSFDIGVATKAGLRLRLLDFLMLGIGIEYTYHNNSLPAYRHMSQFTAGVDAGFSW